jgi:hypothetical protein
MYRNLILGVALLSSLATGLPWPPVRCNVTARDSQNNVPVTDAETAALQASGLSTRSVHLETRDSNNNVPITDAEMAALRASGLSTRSDELEARDHVQSCGQLVAKSGNHWKQGVWIPVQEFANMAQEFCKPSKIFRIALEDHLTDYCHNRPSTHR